MVGLWNFAIGKREALACASVDVINFYTFSRDNPPSPKAMAGQAERQNTSLFLKRDRGIGCEETDFIRREELLCNVKVKKEKKSFKIWQISCSVE